MLPMPAVWIEVSYYKIQEMPNQSLYLAPGQVEYFPSLY